MFNGLISEIYVMKIRFVDGALKTLESRQRAYDVHDPEGTGLTLRVLPHGRKNWVVNYRSPIGIKQKRPIGRFPAMHVAEAREAALSAFSDAQDERA
jgi:hypothetical protein